MITVQAGTFSSLDRHCCQDARPLVQEPVENTRPSFNCVESFNSAQPIDQSTWCLSKSQRELRCSQMDPSEASHLRPIDPQLEQEPSPNQMDSSPAHRRPGLPTRRSSSSLASSIQTVIHLSSSTVIDPAATSRMAHGSFVESESDSSQLLSELSAKSSGEPGPNSEALGDSDNHANNKSSKIQFHDVVRIAGGISSNPKRKRTSKQPPRPISADRRSHITTELHNPSSSSRSPMQYSGFVDGLPNFPKRNISNSDSSDHMSAGYRQARRLDTRDSSSPPISRSMSNSRQGGLRPGPPSSRSSFSYRSRSDSVSPSKLNNFHASSSPHPAGLSLTLTHTLSTSSSFTHSGHFPTTLTSRSSSPASSLYLPLRIPVVRAPAPFFGPTPERVARVRERRQVAQRDAERAKGGWKAWWNNWYHQSDKLANRKGKARQDPAVSHEQQDLHPNPIEDSDSDDGSCYHDVILEHERKKLERKLKQLEQIRVNIHHTPSQSCKHHHKKVKPNSEKNSTTNRQSWLSWISSFAIGLPPPPVHPLRLPTPRSGILRPPTVTAGPNSPGRPVSPLVSSQSCMSPSGPTPKSLAPVQEVDITTPLLARPQNIPNYGNEHAINLPSSDSGTHIPSKSPVEIRFGPAPMRWLTFAWWRWKIGTVLHICWSKIALKFDDIFHIDWDTDRRYEGWENV